MGEGYNLWVIAMLCSKPSDHTCVPRDVILSRWPVIESKEIEPSSRKDGEHERGARQPERTPLQHEAAVRRKATTLIQDPVGDLARVETRSHDRSGTGLLNLL